VYEVVRGNCNDRPHTTTFPRLRAVRPFVLRFTWRAGLSTPCIDHSISLPEKRHITNSRLTGLTAYCESTIWISYTNPQAADHAGDERFKFIVPFGKQW
jgi:hypothetical protein